MTIGSGRTPGAVLGPDSVVWQQLFWPQPLSASTVEALLRHWAAERQQELVLESRGVAGEVVYLIGCKLRFRPAIKRSVEHLIPGVVVTDLDTDRVPVTAVRRVSLSTQLRPLTPVDAAASTRSIMSALSAPHKGELLLIQVVLGRGSSPLTPPPTVADDQQTITSLLFHGRNTQPRAEARRAIAAKLAQHAFSATVRLGVAASTPIRRRSLLLGVASALATTEAPGIRLKLSRDDLSTTNRGSAPRWWQSSAQLRNVAEVAHTLGWPVSDRGDEPLPGMPPRHPRPLPPRHIAREDDRIVAAATAPGVDGDIGYSTTDRLRHTWALGPSGVGKSNLLLSMIEQDLDDGLGLVVIEPKDLIADVLARIPKHRRDDIVILDPLDDHPVGINGLAARPGRRSDTTADSQFAMFHSLYGDSLGPRSSDILRNCLDVLARREDASLVMLPLLLSNAAFRRAATAEIVQDDPFAAGPFWQWFENLSPEAASQVVAPLQNKLRPLLHRSLRTVLAQRHPQFDVRQVFTENKVLLVPLQAGVLGPEAAKLLAAVIVGELWQATRERVAVPEADRSPVMVTIDEAQEYLRLPTDISEALAQARGLKVGFTLANQFRAQFPPAMLAAVDANARSKIVFQLGVADAKAMATGQSTLTADDFGALPAYHVYAQLVRDGAVQPWASGVTRAPSRQRSSPEKIRARSRAQWGRDRSEVDASFSELLTASAPPPAGGRRRRPSVQNPAADTSGRTPRTASAGGHAEEGGAHD
jgi:hypothetical protein